MVNEKTDKRTNILKGALSTFAERGFHGSPTSLIAKEAGVGTGTIYRYFESKDNLILELHREVETKLTETLLSNYSEALPLKERFFVFFNYLLHYLVDHPMENRFLEQFYNSPFGIDKKRTDLENPEQRENDPFYSLFIQGKAQGIFKDLPIEVLCALTIGPLVFLSRDRIAGFIDMNDDLIEEAVHSCWEALLKR